MQVQFLVWNIVNHWDQILQDSPSLCGLIVWIHKT